MTVLLNPIPSFGVFIRKKWKKPGSSDPYAGIYQKRTTKKGVINVKMRFYAPTNPRTPAQQANRQKFADAVSAWQGLTDEEKMVYRKKAVRLKMSGYNLYLRQRMLS